MTEELYERIVAAEQSARVAHDLSLLEMEPFWTRWSLGRAQSILMHYVVKHAGEFPTRFRARSTEDQP